MQSVQRHFGRYMKRSADEQQVSLLLKDFEDADRLLSQLIEEARRWRDAWTSILMHQQRLFGEFDLLYAPIVGAGDDYKGHVSVDTPNHLVTRTNRLKVECEALKTDLKEILDQVDQMMIRPAQDTRDNLQMLRKTIKKREDRKLDYERYQNRVDTSMKKKARSDRDNNVLAKAERELVTATEQYKAADEHLKDVLPPLLQAVWSLQPHLLAAQVQIQNSLLGNYYTSLHTYCTEEHFPSPAPPMDEIIRVWDDALRPAQKEFESSVLLSNGRATRRVPENGHSTGHPTNGYRRPSQNSTVSRGPSISPARAISTERTTRPRITSNQSSTSLLSTSQGLPNDNNQHHYYSSHSPSHSVYATPATSDPNTVPGGNDYFSHLERKTSHAASVTSANSSTSALSSIIAGKKKPPPPPKRLPSHQFQFVTARYDFVAESMGDLNFREGDRIRVIKKTDSTDDWWEGELKGVKGMFPANYCS